MSEVSVFGDPLEEPKFLTGSQPLPQGGERTRTPFRLSLGVILATGLTTASLTYADGATASCGVVEVGVSVGTTGRKIEVGNVVVRSLSTAWKSYLDNLKKVLPGHFARQVRKLWSDLSKSAEQPIPHAGPTQQGSFILTWDVGNQHFEIEVFPDNHFEWFYFDRETDMYEGAEGNRHRAVAAADEYLKRLSAVR